MTHQLNYVLKAVAHPVTEIEGDEFLSLSELVPVEREAADRTARQALAEVEELTRLNKWEDILVLAHPVNEKIPELCQYGLEIPVRAKIGFALGMINRFDEALTEITACVRGEPNNFMYHSQLAYTAYNSLYAAKNREIFLAGNNRSERIGVAHRHFQRCQELRPEGVTAYYREGMLYKEIEGKSWKSMSLFQRAVNNWEKRSAAEQEAMIWERKHYIKSLYQLSSVLLNTDKPVKAMEMIRRCIEADAAAGHISALFKFFALGKIQYHLNQYVEAERTLIAASKCSSERPPDYVYELLGRTYLAMNKLEAARVWIEKIPDAKRRPYYRWTEADIKCAVKDYEGARQVLLKAKERDSWSQHKTLIRLARLEYLLNNIAQADRYAQEADRFYREKWTNPCFDGLFWQAVCAYRLGELKRAAGLADTLGQFSPNYPKLEILRKKIEEAQSQAKGGSS